MTKILLLAAVLYSMALPTSADADQGALCWWMGRGMACKHGWYWDRDAQRARREQRWHQPPPQQGVCWSERRQEYRRC
jgi:hypothetical protein